MEFSLSLRVGKKLEGVLTAGDFVVAEARVRAEKDLFQGLEQILSELLIKSCIPREQIRVLYLAVDFPELFLQKKLPKERIGYIKYLPRGETDLKMDLPLKHYIYTETVTDLEGLQNVLYQQKGSLSIFAINPEISSWFDLSEKAIGTMFREILGESAILSLGSSFNQIGFKSRERVLLINTLLLSGVNFFYDELKRLLEKEKIRCRIFTLKNNGMHMSETWARKFPVFTVEVQFIADLLSLSKTLKAQNIIGLIRKRKKLYLGKIEKFRPELSQTPLNLLHLSIRVLHPILGSVSLKREQIQETVDRLQKEIKRLNSDEENLLVVMSGLNEELKNLIRLYWRSVSKPIFLEADAFGFRHAPICFENEVFVPYNHYEGSRARDQLVRDIWVQLSTEAEAEGFKIGDNWEKFWEERPIRYLPGEASFIRLGFCQRCM